MNTVFSKLVESVFMGSGFAAAQRPGMTILEARKLQ
jgi:hypothetical protein